MKMKNTGRFLSAVMLAVLMTAGLSSCIYDNIPEEGPADQISLFIRLGILDGPASRADASDIECMSSIRIVLLDLDKGGKVEYNEKIAFNNPVTETGFIVIPTVRGAKKIFFIANEESVTLEGSGKSLTELVEAFPGKSDDFEGASGFEDAVNAAYFKLDVTKPLPMTSEYTLDAGRAGENNYTFYVVPAATKYTFNITNKRTETFSAIRRIAIGDLANINYVMPHVGRQYRDWTGDGGTVTSLYWIDWLRNVVEVTRRPENEKVPDNYDENQRLGWILDYELPEGDFMETGPCDMFVGRREVKGVDSAEEDGDPQYVTETFGPYYAPESKTLKYLSDPDGEQTYTLLLELTDGTGKELSLSRELSFVTALFRNTHVVIDITMEMGYMHVYGEIVGWTDNKVYGMLTEED